MQAVTSAVTVRPVASAAGKQQQRKASPSKAAVVVKSTKKSVLLGALASVPALVPGVALASIDKEQAASIAKTIEDDEQAVFDLFSKAAEKANVAKEALSPVAKEYGAPIVNELNKVREESDQLHFIFYTHIVYIYFNDTCAIPKLFCALEN